MIDIVFVTYNSERWLDNCVESIAKSEFDLQQVTLNFADNASTDGTVKHLEQLKKQYEGVFGAFRITVSKANLGFGGGNNLAAKLGTGELIFCLNTDTTLHPDTLQALQADVDASPETVGMWEARQFPYEHPKFYDPVTRETGWCVGACIVMKRALWDQLGGFDEHIFMYAEDVDLSWRVRAEGYTLRYVPAAVVNHYCYKEAGEIKPTQWIYSLVNNLYLRHKFFSEEHARAWHAQVKDVMAMPQPFPGAHKQLKRAVSAAAENFAYAKQWHAENAKKLAGKNFKLIGFDYDIRREGDFFVCERPKGDKKVSVIVRASGRGGALKRTLTCLKWQTYPNLEIVVIEDGPNLHEKLIRKEFADLNIVYVAMGQRKGMSKAFNRGLSLATGDYINLIEDGELLFADHVEALVMELERNPGKRIAYGFAFNASAHPRKEADDQEKDKKAAKKSDKTDGKEDEDTDKTVEEAYDGSVKSSFSRFGLMAHNLFPLHVVMFERAVWEELGGLDEDLRFMADWNLWVRFATRYAFQGVEKTTAVYHPPMPPTKETKEAREKELEAVRAKHNTYEIRWTVEEVLAECEDAELITEGGLPSAVVPVQRSIPYRIARKCYRILKRMLGR